MDTGQAAFLEIGDGFGSITNRWQSYWIDQVVSWDSRTWTYQQLDWAGLVSGQAVGDQATITLPAVPSVLALTEQALAGAWVAQLRIIQFDESLVTTTPPTTYVLAASCIGQVIGASGSLTQVTWRLGSALSPIGAQFPPVTATTALIGVPCRL